MADQAPLAEFVACQGKINNINDVLKEIREDLNQNIILLNKIHVAQKNDIPLFIRDDADRPRKALVKG